MPDQMPSPAAASVPGQGGPQQAPMGSSSITGPTPNRGFEAAGMQKLAMAIKMLTDALPLLGATSEVGGQVMDTIKKLGKHIQPGAMTPASERNNIEQMAMRNQQNSQLQQQMKQQQAGAGAEAGAGSPPMPKAA